MATLRVTEAFAYFDNGLPVVMSPGALVADDHPAVKGREDKFEPVEVAAARLSPVEQATAAPGERRTRAAKKSAAKKV